VAKKKATTKTSTAKKSTKPTTAKSTPKPKPEPAGPTYEEVIEARRAMDQAHAEVMSAERSLRSARTIMSDFKLRDRAVAEAEEKLASTRARAGAATAHFQELKYRSK
jgi:hypothetical protein